MTDNQTTQIIDTLEKIEKHLQAIDWKFWDIHQKLGNNNTSNTDVEQPVNLTSIKEEDTVEHLADIINKVDTVPPVVKHTLKYPSIEIIK